jgi:hypothetical protein
MYGSRVVIPLPIQLLKKIKFPFSFLLKCPVCIYVESLTTQQGYSLMEK